MLHFLSRAYKALRNDYSAYNFIRRSFPKSRIERNVFFKGDLRNLVLDGRVAIQFGSVIHLGGFEWCNYQGHLEIGDASVISPNCTIFAAGSGGVRIGKRFDCGPGVCIFASRTDYIKGVNEHIFAPVIIGDDVTVFANSVISPGVRLGDGSVIAACSVVTTDVPPGSFVGGAPARVLKEDFRIRAAAQTRRLPALVQSDR